MAKPCRAREADIREWVQRGLTSHQEYLTELLNDYDVLIEKLARVEQVHRTFGSTVITAVTRAEHSLWLALAVILEES